MPGTTSADTIRILVSTDNHVGYNERDPVRGDDSWKSFHEVMCLAKERDVDMVLLAGDLFHENKPSRKSMYQVIRSLRMNCYGEKPCELEMLSDASENFAGAFNHVNYEDPDINVAIPVFSIHGNHDDPSGEGGLAALDILQMSGLVNYYGRTPQADNIQVKPVLLQKGNTKLALYGLSNVRDERLFRTFRDGNVKFFQPSTQKDDWFNLMSVHQNHHAYTDTGYLPEGFLPHWMDLVIWGHEHECKIDPITNPETSFRVIQPGSSVATSLVPGEAVAKQVTIVSVTGKEFHSEPIRLKTVRPFVMREIALIDDKEMREVAMRSGDIKPKIMKYLMDMIKEMIEEAKEEWLAVRREAGEDDGEDGEDVEVPKPLIRLRVEYTAPEGGDFPIENSQRFSSRFQDEVANVSDVIQFHRKRKTQKAGRNVKPDMPEDSVMAEMQQMETIKIGDLVKEFLTAQSLTILPQNNFSDAVTDFVDKDDKTAMTEFIDESLKEQVKFLIEDGDDEVDEERMYELMESYKEKCETQFSKGGKKKVKKGRKQSRKPRPDYYDSDMDGPWEENISSIVRDDDGNAVEDDDEEEEDEEETSTKPKAKSTRGRGGKAAAGTTRKTAAAKKKSAPAKATGGRGKKKAVVEEEDEDDDEDVVMTNGNSHDTIEIDDDDDDDEDSLFTKPAAAAKKAPAAKKAAPAKSAASKASSRAGTQSRLPFASQASQANGTSSRAAAKKAPPKRTQEPSDDEISDDDAFEPPPAASQRQSTRRR